MDDRIKTLLTVAPIVALVMAIAYLQGYWGYYDILIFPYLSSSELIAYAAAPLFGFLVSASIGVFLGAINATTNDRKPSSKLRDTLEIIIFIGISVLLIYIDHHLKWIFVPLVVLCFISARILNNEAIRDRVKESPHYYLLTVATLFLVIGSFGYGRSKAQELAETSVHNIQVVIDEKCEKTRFLGKISSYYFFLDLDGKVRQHPESAIKKITYEKLFKKG